MAKAIHASREHQPNAGWDAILSPRESADAAVSVGASMICHARAQAYEGRSACFRLDDPARPMLCGTVAMLEQTACAPDSATIWFMSIP